MSDLQPDPVIRSLVIGPAQPGRWWDEHTPKGDCQRCGGDCDGADCGLHAAGCIFGGFTYGYWMYAPDCPRFHGVTDDPA